MASPDLQTQRMEAFTKMLRSGRNLFDEATKETPSEERDAQFEDYKRRATFAKDLEEETLYSVGKAMKDIKQRALMAELEFAEEYALTSDQAGQMLAGTSDFATIQGIRNREVQPGQEIGTIGIFKKFKHQGMDGPLMTVLSEKMALVTSEMQGLQRVEKAKKKYGASISIKDAERLKELKEEVNYLHSKFNKDSWITGKMKTRRGTKDSTTRSQYLDYVKNIEAYKLYLDTLGR
jgi:hypothetical protein